MWWTVLLVIAVVIAGILALAATKPNTFRIERSARIQAPPEGIFPLLDDFHRWPEWSPWEKLDPELRRTYGGPERGVGATYAWEGNKKVGSGRMEIVESSPHTSLRIKLDFLTPFEAHNVALFDLVPDGDHTRLVWAMEGPQPFMNKVMCVFINFDRMVGTDFEKGLAALRAIAEAEHPAFRAGAPS